jgi:hypothetical protein
MTCPPFYEDFGMYLIHPQHRHLLQLQAFFHLCTLFAMLDAAPSIAVEVRPFAQLIVAARGQEWL